MSKSNSNIIWIILLVGAVLYLGSKTDLFSAFTSGTLLSPTNGPIPVEIAGKNEGFNCPGNSLVWYSNTASLGFGTNGPRGSALGLGYAVDGVGQTYVYTKDQVPVTTLDAPGIFENDEFKFNPSTRRTEYKIGRVSDLSCSVFNYVIGNTSTATCTFKVNQISDDLRIYAFTGTIIPGSRVIDFYDLKRDLDHLDVSTQTVTFNLPSETEEMNKKFYIVIVSDKPAVVSEVSDFGQGCFLNVYPQMTLLQNYEYKIVREQSPLTNQTQQQTYNQTQVQQNTPPQSGSSGVSNQTQTGGYQAPVPATTTSIFSKLTNPVLFIVIIGAAILLIFLWKRKQ